MGTVKGRIHSFESGGMVDGPGIRFVVFTQGCPLRCLYCHNPDSWKNNAGEEYTAEEIIEKALQYKSYMGQNGGITISGGEPLLQPDFLRELLTLARQEGIHTAVDTSGYASKEAREAVLLNADLVLLDIKSIEPDVFRKVSGAAIDHTMAALDELKQAGIPVWIRHVIVPGITDRREDAVKMADYLTDYPNIERIELLPFHKMGEYKWKELEKTYQLEDTPTPEASLMEDLRQIFSERNLPVF